ncbi:conserved hypothetical protein [Leishmania mexicana MHOM/GT/2001/U1103]|uniref:Uncharacterized protein n=1 Tax=Leishmania mexicana (strain MHOM/GT/2001/U1103) TaxID=929439 RepID=E9AP29_LEIMU|nr:conserved hypothetical protein [Leishmania mexicana MHOM/GT/2001/U1103]CBZ24693.1 conserved hypothetical protein [Leishmania mexicana MHOM/GT/2001/U1103]
MEGSPIENEAREDLRPSMAPASALLPNSAAYSADVDAIEIADVDIKEPFPAGADRRDMLVGTGGALRGGEEMPPCISAPYMEALLNTDPRISFDALHIGALRAIEEREEMNRPHYDYLSWCVPPTEFVEHPPSGGVPFFTVPLMHPAVRTRPPLDRSDHEVDELLSHPTRETLIAAIGADMLEHLRFSRNVDMTRRRRSKRAAAGGKG